MAARWAQCPKLHPDGRARVDPLVGSHRSAHRKAITAENSRVIFKVQVAVFQRSRRGSFYTGGNLSFLVTQ